MISKTHKAQDIDDRIRQGKSNQFPVALWANGTERFKASGMSFETGARCYCVLKRAEFEVGKPKVIGISYTKTRRPKYFECTLLQDQTFKIEPVRRSEND